MSNKILDKEEKIMDFVIEHPIPMSTSLPSFKECLEECKDKNSNTDQFEKCGIKCVGTTYISNDLKLKALEKASAHEASYSKN